VFEPPLGQSSLMLGWTSGAETVQSATEVLMVYRDDHQAAAGTTAVFPLIDAWKSAPPFQVEMVDTAVPVSLNGGAPASKTVRYGYGNFPTQCSDAWIPGGSYGRICIQDSTAPFYNGFSAGETDHCPDSASSYDAVDCTASLRFTISVR